MPRVRRPSPALVVAVVALVVALAGSADAVSHLINGSKLAKRSVAGNRLKKNAVRGSEVKEPSLGKVPAAHRADQATSAKAAGSATSAQNASKVGGLSASALVQGGGKRFAFSQQIAKNT